MTRVRILDMLFDGSRQTSGFTIAKDGFTGWEDGTAIRRVEALIPQGHGAYDLPGFLSPRVVSVSGLCRAASAGQLEYFGRQLSGLLADGSSATIMVDKTSTTYGVGRLTGVTQFEVLLPGSIASYQVQFWFPNPRKFGNTLTFASGVPSYHYGNFIAAPVHTVTGTMPTGYTITGPSGKTFIVTQPVVAGSPHVIDMGTGYLSINGVVIAGGVSDGSTWGVPAGGQVTQTLTPASGTGTLSTAVQDTYV